MNLVSQMRGSMTTVLCYCLDLSTLESLCLTDCTLNGAPILFIIFLHLGRQQRQVHA